MNQDQYIEVNRNHLKAVAMIMAKQDLRYYLNGVAVESGPDYTTLIATDGHKLLVIRDQAANTLQEPTVLIIPSDIVKVMLAHKLPKSLSKIPMFKKDEGKWQVPLFGLGTNTNIEFKQIEGAFPDWRKVIPQEQPTGEAAQFNAKYIAEFQSAANAAAGYTPFRSRFNYIRIFQNGEKGAIVRSPSTPEFLGILMPIKDTDKYSTPVPAWATEKPSKKVEKLYIKR